MKTEQIVTMPILNPETGHPAKAHKFAGKLDLIENGVLSDWKTCTDPRKFLDQRTLSYQGELYALAADVPISEIQYRLIMRPTIKFCGKDKDEDGKPNRKMYEDRCLEWLLQKEGATLEHVHHINPARMKQAREWLWSIHKRILHCEKHGYLTNEHGCNAWFKECPFLPLCLCDAQGGDVHDVIAERYQKKEHKHSELGKVDGDTITFSSASCLALCEQKFQLQYKELLESKRQDDGDALFIGNVAHIGLEHFKATRSEAGGMAAIDEWEGKNIVLGADANHAQDQNIAKARAIVRAAALRWPSWDVAEGITPKEELLF